MRPNEFKEYLERTVHAGLIAQVVIGTATDIEAGKYGLDEKVSLGYTVRDLRNCTGWWTLPPLIEDMVAAATGRIATALADGVGFQMKAYPMTALVDVLLATQGAERVAVGLVLTQLATQFGNPTPSPNESEPLLKKVLASQQQAGMMMSGPTKH